MAMGIEHIQLTDVEYRGSHRENAALRQQFSTGALPHTLCMSGPRTNLRAFSSVPTKNDILVPETLLKKRKSQEKARAEKAAEIQKKKAVSRYTPQQPLSI
jgi:hypothetical protein